MKRCRLVVAGLIALIGSVSVAEAAQRVSTPSDQVDSFGVSIGGPEFMATFGGLPTVTLQRTETSNQAVRLAFEQEWPDRWVGVGVSVVRLGTVPQSYLQTHLAQVQETAEQMFRDEANGTCSRPVSVTRRMRPPAVAAGGATPIRLEALCRAPKDTRWSAVFFVSEQLVNGNVQCGWTLQWGSRSGEGASSHPVQDVCIPMQGVGRGGNVSVNVIQPSNEQ